MLAKRQVLGGPDVRAAHPDRQFCPTLRLNEQVGEGTQRDCVAI